MNQRARLQRTALPLDGMQTLLRRQLNTRYVQGRSVHANDALSYRICGRVISVGRVLKDHKPVHTLIYYTVTTLSKYCLLSYVFIFNNN